MREKVLKTAKKRTWLIFGLVSAALLAPIAVYIHTFGLMITADHERWSEMGSAMSGIYTPILTILTLLVLLAQVGLQEKMNRHTFDQAFIQEARSDIHFYLDQIAKESALTFEDGSAIGQALIDTFSYASKQQLSSSSLADIAKKLNKKHPGLLASWSGFYSALAGLSANDWYPYTNAYVGAKQKATAILSYPGCAALDNYAFAVSEGKLQYCKFACQLAES